MIAVCDCCRPNTRVKTQMKPIYDTAVHNERNLRIGGARLCEDVEICRTYGYCNGKCVMDIAFYDEPVDTLPQEYLNILRRYGITEDDRLTIFNYIVG